MIRSLNIQPRASGFFNPNALGVYLFGETIVRFSLRCAATPPCQRWFSCICSGVKMFSTRGAPLASLVRSNICRIDTISLLKIYPACGKYYSPKIRRPRQQINRISHPVNPLSYPEINVVFICLLPYREFVYELLQKCLRNANKRKM